MAKYEKGDNVMYISNNGDIEIGVVVNVHFDDNPPYYTIKLNRTGGEKVTDENNLTILEEEEEEEEGIHKEEVNKVINNDESTTKVNQENKKESIKLIENNSILSSKWIVISLLLSLGTLVSYKFFKNSFFINKIK